MRAPLALAVALVLTVAGCGDPACAPGTVLLTVSFSGASAEADALDVTLQLDGGPPITRSVAHTPGESSGTIEVDFSSMYPAGQSLVFTVVASANGDVVGRGTQSGSVGPGCAALELAIGDAPDMATDLDLATPDLTTPPDLLPSVPPPLCSADHWCWVNPLPQGNGLVQVYGFAANDVWAVGSAGALMHWNGSGWTRYDVTSADLWSVWGLASDDVWAGGMGVMLHWNGKTWTVVVNENPINDTFVSIWGSSSNDIYAAGSSATVAHCNPGQCSLTTVGDGTEFFTSVGGSSASDVWLVGQQLWHSTGSGFTVAATQPPTGSYPLGIYVDGPGDAWFVGRQIVHLSNGAFQTSSNVTPNSLQYVWGTSGSDVWACGRNGTVIHFDGKTWNAGFTPGTNVYLYGGWTRAANDVWLVGDAGTILHYDGSTFSSLSSGFHTQLADVWGAGTSDVWTVGLGGAMYHYDGQSWSTVKSGTTNDLNGIWGSSSDDVWAVGAAGTILHWSGAGQGWKAVSSGVTFDLSSVWGSRSNDVWAVGSLTSNGTSTSAPIVHWDGSSWSGGYTFSSPFAAAHLNAVRGANAPGEVWAVGNSTATSGGVNAALFARYPGSGIVWSVSTVAGANDVADVWAGQFSTFAVGNNNLYSDVSGNWSAASAPNQMVMSGLFGLADNDVYAVGSAYGAPAVLHWNGSIWSTQSAGADSLNKVWGTASDDLWAVGNAGTILHRGK